MPHIQPELLKRKVGGKFQVVGKEGRGPLSIKSKPAPIQKAKAKPKVTASKSAAKTAAAKAAMSKASPAKKVGR